MNRKERIMLPDADADAKTKADALAKMERIALARTEKRLDVARRQHLLL